MKESPWEEKEADSVDTRPGSGSTPRWQLDFG